MNPQYRTSLAAAASSQPNLGGSPNGNSAQIQNLQNLAATGFRSDAVDKATGGFIGDANATVAAEAAQRAAANAAADRATALKKLKDKIAADLVDPANYIKQVSADGGWNFYKPDGTPISVLEYSQVVGKQVPDVLSGSTSQQDSEFKTDYEKLKEYGAALAGDDDAMSKFKEKNTDWLAQPGNSNKTYAEIVKDFHTYYGGYLQPSQSVANEQAVTNNANTTLTPGGWLGIGNRNGVNYK